MSKIQILLCLHVFSIMGTLTTTESDTTALTSQIKKLEESLSALQASSQLQERKQAAVLSSVLSKLTMTTSELNDLKKNYSSLEHNLTAFRDNNHSNQVQQLEQAVSSLQLQVQKHANCTSFENELMETRNDLKALKKNYSSLEVKLTATESELSTIRDNHLRKIQQLQQNMSTSQAQSQELDQNQTVVLTNVLSKLTENTIELTTLKTNYSSLENGLFTTLQNNHSSQVQTQIQKQCHNELVQLKDCLSKIETAWKEASRKTDIDVKDLQSAVSRLKALLNKDVAFEVFLSGRGLYNVSKESALKFTMPYYNDVNGYNPSTGHFTAPIAGTYIFWVSCAFTGLKASQINILKNGRMVGLAYGSLFPTYTSGNTRGMTVFSLDKGDTVYFSSTAPLSLIRGVSSFGGALLHPRE